ncbi:MAG: hypothetical protein LC808_16350, partial [Actinobacteria bacterium]|nr:hypothetical protein [Actinomycetota bacterium]
ERAYNEGLGLGLYEARVGQMSEKYRTNPFYNGVSTFKAAFPELQDALVVTFENRPYKVFPSPCI